MSGVIGGICGEDRSHCGLGGVGLRIIGGGENDAATAGRSRSRDPDDGPGSEVVTMIPISSMSFGVLIGENIVAPLLSVLVAKLAVSMRGRLAVRRRVLAASGLET